MRVGYLTYGLDRAPTGIGRYAVELLHALAALPNAPEIVLLTTERSDPHGLWQQFERVALPGCAKLPALMTIGNLALARAARYHHLDLIHDPNGIAPFLALGGRTRSIVTIHDAFAYVYPQAHNRLDNWRYRWMLPLAARRSDAVLTDSNHSHTDLIRYLKLDPAAVQTIACGIDPRFQPIEQITRAPVLEHYGIRSPYLLYVGSINGRKNIARLFEAFAQVRAAHPDVTLVIGGKRQWQTGEIDATFDRLKLDDDVHFTGYVDDADLPALYSGAAAFVFPSLYEGFGLPPLEAMACGTPVITSNVSSLPEVVGDAALTVDPYDVQALAGAMRRVLTDGGLRAILQERGRARAQLFTWQQTAHHTVAAYNSLFETTRRHASTPRTSP